MVKHLRGPAPQVSVKSPCRTLTLLAHKQVQTHRPRWCGHTLRGYRCGWRILRKNSWGWTCYLACSEFHPQQCRNQTEESKQEIFQLSRPIYYPPGQYLMITSLTQLLGWALSSGCSQQGWVFPTPMLGSLPEVKHKFQEESLLEELLGQATLWELNLQIPHVCMYDVIWCVAEQWEQKDLHEMKIHFQRQMMASLSRKCIQKPKNSNNFMEILHCVL